jgi:hypothetical protein
MIQTKHELRMAATGFDQDFVSERRVIMEMSTDDALALATVLMNLDDEIIMISHEWNQALRRVATMLVKEVNACR